jgi:hypothetical protein
MEIYESYKSYVPPRWVRPSIERLLKTLAPEHTGGLGAIVLTSSEAVGRGKTGRVGGRKYERRRCRGFYHYARPNQLPWIEVVVDSTIGHVPAWITAFNFCRDCILARTLYHEVGHHLDATVGSASRGGEAAAEDWRRRLTRLHNQRRYWYLRPVFLFVRALFRLVMWIPAIARERDKVAREMRVMKAIARRSR